ncbi:nucleoside-diphosphate sugar epimerase [Tersicoccus solisilvae]|uniref:Nucleoside-diphosphate sugar epimerase n=1 Tax=Tersicoccus solisilvae TaxID=1882339 RepID=A0ABQ1PBQ3_9MICC|nr:SDR family oxidoreductase [Tersicoccus solisilvae]GGC94089.1 nucleoside-diphosphate sugar epimerase [Tersicoccus solisilvae]
MTDHTTTVLILGATGSIGRPAVSEALRQGHAVRALVRDRNRAARLLPDSVELVVGDLTQPDTLDPAVEGIDAVVFTHGTTNERDVRDTDYAGVANTLKALGPNRARIALMTAIGVTRPGLAYAEWKLRSERLVRASGNPYTIVRPGWFDDNDADQRTLVMLQGDRRQSGGPADGVVARDQIARVLIDSLSTASADRKTFELVADRGEEQTDLSPVFASLIPDPTGALDAVEDSVNLPPEREPERFRQDLAAIAAGSAGPAVAR